MEVLNKIIDKIKNAQNPDLIITEIIKIIRMYLEETKLKKINDAINWLKKIGSTIRQECPNAFPILNILSRTISILDEILNIKSGKKPSSSERKLFQYLNEIKNPKEIIGEEPSSALITELFEELSFESINEEIVILSNDHLEEGETVLVLSQSELMKEFVTSAIEKKNVNVVFVVSELGQNCFIEQNTSKNVVYITEKSVFSVINKVSKIFMDCHAVMADGAVINTSGSFTVVAIAKEYSIPVIILSPMYRFTPFYSFTQESYNNFLSPQSYFDKAFSLENLEIVVAQYDVISSDCVSFVITELGEYSNNYILQALGEYYGNGDLGYQF